MNFQKLSAAVIAALFFLIATTRAQVFTASLTGPNENPTNASPGTGFAMVTLNLAAHTYSVDVNFTGLTGTTTGSHIHAPVTIPGGTAGVATQVPAFSGFPLGVTSGNFSNTFDMTNLSTWNSPFVTANGGTAAGAEAAFVSAVQNGTAYLNIHTSTFTGGEIRGFLLPVPEPASITLFAVGAAGLGVAAWKRRWTPA